MGLFSPAVRPAVGSGSVLEGAYTCAGGDSWPPLRWQGVPPETTELVLFVMNLQPVDGKLFFDWAVAGIDPQLRELETGRLPPGAVMGRNGFGDVGYSVCPLAGKETYVFALYALPDKLMAQRGFDPRALRKEVLRISGDGGFLVVEAGSS